MTGNDNGKKLEDNTCVQKALAKEAKFYLEHAREALMEAKKSFVEASTSGRKNKPKLEMYPSMPTTFLETCMNLLCDSKVVKRLQELINK